MITLMILIALAVIFAMIIYIGYLITELQESHKKHVNIFYTFSTDSRNAFYSLEKNFDSNHQHLKSTLFELEKRIETIEECKANLDKKSDDMVNLNYFPCSSGEFPFQFY